MTLVYFISIFVDTLAIGFHMTPLLIPNFATWSMVLSLMMIIDTFLKFFVALRANAAANQENEEEEEEEKSQHINAKVGPEEPESGEQDIRKQLSIRQKQLQEMNQRATE